MKIIATTLLAASAALFASSGMAEARDAYSFRGYSSGHGGYNGYSSSHGRTHDSLNHNEYHRQSNHNAAHRYPMSQGQHGGLYDQLNQDRYHDGARHDQSHRSYPTYGNSFYGGWRGYTAW